MFQLQNAYNMQQGTCHDKASVKHLLEIPGSIALQRFLFGHCLQIWLYVVLLLMYNTEKLKVYMLFTVDARNTYTGQDGSSGQPGMELALTDQNR